MTAGGEGLTDWERSMAIAFDSLVVIDARCRPAGNAPERESKVPFADLYRFAVDHETARSAAVERAIAEDDTLRATFVRLLDKLAQGRSTRLAAASTGGTTERVGDGFTIRLRPSRASGGQVYVQITLTAAGASPRMLVAVGPTGRVVRRSLPTSVDGVIQLLVAGDDPLLACVTDPGTSIHLT